MTDDREALGTGGTTILIGGDSGESFTLTTRLRWLTRVVTVVKLPPFYQPQVTTTQVLQQMWIGEKGTQRWQDVPTETER